MEHNPCALIQPCELQACCRAFAPLSCVRRPTHTQLRVLSCAYVDGSVCTDEALQRHVPYCGVACSVYSHFLMISLPPTPRNHKTGHPQPPFFPEYSLIKCEVSQLTLLFITHLCLIILSLMICLGSSQLVMSQSE